MAATITTTTTTEVELKPALKLKLRRELKAYQAVKEQLEALEQAAKVHKGRIGALREEAGVQTLKVDGFTVTYVTSTRVDQKRFKMKLIEMGVTADMFEEATEASLKPGTPYEKITLPGAKQEED